MIITITGTNHFMLNNELNQLVADFVAKYTDMGLEKYNGEDIDPSELPSMLQALPFLADKRMIVLREPSAQKALQDKMEQLVDQVPDTTDLVIVETKLDKRTSYYKTLREKTDFRLFEDLDEHSLRSWLVGYAKNLGASISSADAAYLIRRVGTNQLLLSNEIKKLINYSPQITRQTIDGVTEPTPQSSVFELLDAAFAGDRVKTLGLYREQRQQKIEPLAILGMIAWQLHVFAVIKTAGSKDQAAIAKEAKLNPFVVRKSASLSRKLSLQELKSLVKEAYNLDVRLKSRQIDADDALSHFLLSLAA